MHCCCCRAAAAVLVLLPPCCLLQAPDGVEETDELLLWDEEMADIDPEALPKRLLTDFSIYNAEVRGAGCTCSTCIHAAV